MSKIALVTGGSRGIGNAIALDLLEKGYCVGVGYHKNKSMAQEIAENNSQALPLNIDITSEKSIQKAFNEIETNFMSAVRCIKLALPAMIKKGGGRIINIASIGGQWGGVHQIHYAASKAALINLTKSIAKSYSKEGICCNAVSPGLINTDMIADELKKTDSHKLKNIPIGRHGTVDEVSSLVGFLCSEESSYITGQVLNVNGGMNLCE